LTQNGSYDAFITKVNPNGDALVYAGYIGGSLNDDGRGIAVDGSGAAYITGYTLSDTASFPVGTGPGLTYNGTGDAYVAKVLPNGSALAFCGYIGGNGYDSGSGIAVDAGGAAYIAGSTLSNHATFPDVTGPDLSYNGGSDAFVAKVRPNGTALIYAGYIGGEDDEFGNNIAIDGNGAAYVTGETYSNEATFPARLGPDLTYNGDDDAFTAMVRPDGTGLVYAGYIGGSDKDYSSDIAVDANGAAYITGFTSSDQTTFPVRTGPDLSYNGVGDAFVARIVYLDKFLFLPISFR
jgi:Tol biopolymer transport system component